MSHQTSYLWEDLSKANQRIAELEEELKQYKGNGQAVHSSELRSKPKPKLLYLRGEPGTGKITVARILAKRLGWKLFWLHDLDAVCKIVGRYPLPRLMDTISEEVLWEMMETGENLIYIRPSRDNETVEGVIEVANSRTYSTTVIRLMADYKTLCERVTSRPSSEFRVSSIDELNNYLSIRPSPEIMEYEWRISTDERTPEWVANIILSFQEMEAYVPR